MLNVLVTNANTNFTTRWRKAEDMRNIFQRIIKPTRKLFGTMSNQESKLDNPLET